MFEANLSSINIYWQFIAASLLSIKARFTTLYLSSKMYHLGLEQESKKKKFLKLLAYATEINARALRAEPPALTYMVFYVFKLL